MIGVTGWRGWVVGAIVPGALLLGGCGDDNAADPSAADGSDSPSTSVETSEPGEPSPSDSPIEPSESAEPLPDWPACDDVWVKDKKIPRAYKGCLQGEFAIKALQEYCEFGKRLIIYNDRFWGVRGGKVNDANGPLKDSQDFLDDLASCQA